MRPKNLEEKKQALEAYAAELAEEDNGAGKRGAKRAKKKRAAKTAVFSVTAALAVGAIAGLSVALAYSEDMNSLRSEYMRDMEGVYTRHYYDLSDSANALDVALGKLNAAYTASAQQDILYDVWNAAGLAGVSLSAFEGGEEGVMQASKFVNQTGDYAHYLAERLDDGEPLSREETEKLAKLRAMTGVLRRALGETREGISEGRLFLGEDGMLAELTGAFDAFADPEVDYPEMIYDGPFSDALEHRECKAVKGMERITPEEGAELLKEYIADASKIEYLDRTESDAVTLNYSVTTEAGRGFAQLTEEGGMLIAYNILPERRAAAEGDPQACAVARAFAKRAGYGDLAVVWCASAQGTTYVNLTPVQDGAVLYPDLIKVKVDEGSGEVTGLDATHYLYNHTDRTLPEAKLTVAEAEAKLSLPAVSEGRLALIPMDETKEVLTYEFECEREGTYFVYIDALTGEETNILYVIDDTEQGEMLM